MPLGDMSTGRTVRPFNVHYSSWTVPDIYSASQSGGIGNTEMARVCPLRGYEGFCLRFLHFLLDMP